MKTAFKKSLAFVMMLCMLLGTVSAFAANEDSDMSALKKVESLKKGDKGQVVRALTYQLKAHGYLAYVSSNFDDTVKTALSRFQYDNGYSANGIANKKTIDLLLSGRGLTTDVATVADPNAPKPAEAGSDADMGNLNKVGTIKKGFKGAAVRSLTQRLIDLNYLEGYVTNNFNATVEAAVKAFQYNHGLKVTGEVDSKTKEVLNRTQQIVEANKPVGKITEEANKPTVTDKTADDYMGNLKNAVSLKKGDEGQNVRALTSLLVDKGYMTYVSSQYSSSVVKAIKAFQYNNGYADTGVADQKTIKLLLSGNGLANPTNPIVDKNEKFEDTNADSYMGNLKAAGSVAVGQTGQTVRALTYLLKTKGYLSSVSSNYNETVKAAVAAFQEANGIAVTGVANYGTVAKLLGSK